MGTGHRFEEVRDLKEAGKLDDAVHAALHRDTKEIRDAGVHLEWASLCEELGLYPDAVLELNLALRDGAAPEPIHRKLANLHTDLGNWEKAIRHFKALILIDPEDWKLYRDAALLLSDLGETAEARSILEKGIYQTNAPALRSLLSDMAGSVSLRGAADGPAAERVPENVPDELAFRLFASFEGREGVYAKQWVSPTGETGYTPVHEAFTAEVARNHILGNVTVGLYPVRLDGMVLFTAFDVDIAKSVYQTAQGDDRRMKVLLARCHAVACRIADIAASGGIPVLLEDSGNKGRHVWILLEKPAPARLALQYARAVISLLGRPFPEIHVECFPKQGFLRPGSLGNLIKLPLGVHRRTGRPSKFLLPDNRHVEDPLSLLRDYKRVSPEAILRWIRANRFAVEGTADSEPHTGGPVRGGKYGLPGDGEDDSSEGGNGVEPQPARGPHRGEGILIPSDEEYELDTDEEAQCILSRCAVMRGIREKAAVSKELTAEEQLAVAHVFGHLEHGPQAVAAMLDGCMHIHPSAVLRSRFRGNPVSCGKIRAKIPEIASPDRCACDFEEDAYSYPTPLIHLWRRKSGETVALAPLPSVRIDRLAEDYLSARKRMREIEEWIRDLEARLEAYFTEAGVDSVRTRLGRLLRTEDGNGGVSYRLEV
jgi:tetratricopeptide (TPR) repeat protein